MSVATATPVQTQRPNISADLRSIVTEVQSEFFERIEHVPAVVITMLARQHCFILGPPGTGKTDMVEEICHRITDARFWSILMDRQLGKE